MLAGAACFSACLAGLLVEKIEFMIISTVQVKGGTGKTTIAAHLAGYLFNQGHRVSVLDADPQQGASLWLKAALPLVEVVPAHDPDEILDLLPSMEGAADFVICDGPAGGAEPTRALMLRSSLALLPCGPSVLDLRALADSARLVKQAQSIRKGKPGAVVVLNKMEPHTNLSREIREAAPSIGLDVAAGEIRKRAAYADSFGQGLFVWNMGYAAREASQEIEALFMEILNQWQSDKAQPKP